MGGSERRGAPSVISPAGVKAAVAAQSLPHSHSLHLLHILWAAQAGFGRLQPWLLVPSEHQSRPCSLVADRSLCVPRWLPSSRSSGSW